MKEEKKLEQQKALNAEKALSDEELDAVSGGFGQQVTTENGVMSFTCTCGTVLTVVNNDAVCPKCKASWSLDTRGRMLPSVN